MATSSTAIARQPLEDPLAHLPCSTVVHYRKGQVIYFENDAATNLYLVMEGRVEVTQSADNGDPVLVDIYRRDEFFGESALLHLPHRSERATAFMPTEVMTWTAAELEEVVMRRPRLGIALWQNLARRNADLEHRISSFAADTIARRLARSLLRFSGRLGTPDASGATRMPPMTHEMLSHYVGTSREIVTHYMSEFRRWGYLNYSRQAIIVYRPALQEWLGQPGSHAMTEPQRALPAYQAG